MKRNQIMHIKIKHLKYSKHYYICYISFFSINENVLTRKTKQEFTERPTGIPFQRHPETIQTSY